MFDLSTLTTAPVFADWDGPGWWIVFAPLAWFIVIASLILLFRFVIFRRAGWGPGWDGRSRRLSAAEVLERRFAEGELSAAEYRERRAVLSEQPRPSSSGDD
jgi:putative membrane protein